MLNDPKKARWAEGYSGPLCPSSWGDIGGGIHGVCLCLGSVQQPELECLPWGHHVTPRDIIAVRDISTLWGIVTLQDITGTVQDISTLQGVFKTLWVIIILCSISPEETQSPYGSVTPWGTVTLWGIITLWDVVTLHGISTLWGIITPCSIVTLRGRHRRPQGIVTVCQPLCSLPALCSSHVLCLCRDTMALCGSACLGTGTSLSASSACLGTWASPSSSGTRSLSPAWGQDP